MESRYALQCGIGSHELRSPLARLSVAEGLLRQCPSEEREEFLNRIEIEVERLDQLIGQLLTLRVPRQVISPLLSHPDQRP